MSFKSSVNGRRTTPTTDHKSLHWHYGTGELNSDVDIANVSVRPSDSHAISFLTIGMGSYQIRRRCCSQGWGVQQQNKKTLSSPLRRGLKVCHFVCPSVCPSVTLSPPKPLDEGGGGGMAKSQISLNLNDKVNL